ncbi:MAG: GNAT family N-acetyltransferase [Sphingomonadales bacterium]
MAQLQPMAWQGRDGAVLMLRSAQARDARALIGLTRRVLASAAHMVQEVAEYDIAPRGEKRWILHQRDNPDGLYLVAQAADGALVGMLDCRGEPRWRRRHAVTLGLAIDPDWQGRGLGRALMHRALDWARGHPGIERVELHVHAANAPALALYRQLGFLEEGRRARAIKHRDGRYCDDLLMCAFVGAANTEV